MKKLDEKTIWMMTMCGFPALFSMSAAEMLTDVPLLQPFYAAALGGLGGLFGFGVYYLTANKSRTIKALSVLGIIAICVFAIRMTSPSTKSDEQLVEEDWIVQEIGHLSFESPLKLNLINDRVPEQVEEFYSSLKLYSDEQNDRNTFFIESEIYSDSFSIAEGFEGALLNMLANFEVDTSQIEFDVYEAETGVIAAKYSFPLNGDMVSGFGYMFWVNHSVESIWLMPVKRGFSNDYIDSFYYGISPFMEIE